MAEQKKLLLFDGLSVTFRVFYAINPLSFCTPDGQHTNAVYGFLRMLCATVDKYRPTHLAVAFDYSSKTFRKQLYPPYKEGRKPVPEEFAGQVPLIKQALESLQVPIIELEGYEADDILATLAHEGEREGFEVRVVSGDRDAFQLITSQVSVLYPTPKGDVLYDPVSFELKYGLPPEQYPELAALVGEGADNLPGVPGVGPKTALAWLQKYGDLQKVLEAAPQIGGKRGQALQEAKADVLRNRKLNHLLRDTPIQVGPAQLRYGTGDPTGFERLAERCQFGPKIRSDVLKSFTQAGLASELNPAPLEQIPALQMVSRGQFAQVLSSFDPAQGVGLSVLGDPNPGAPRAHGVALRQGSQLYYARFSQLDAADRQAFAQFIGETADGNQGERPKLCYSNWKNDYHCLRGAGFEAAPAALDKTLLAYLVSPDAHFYAAADFAESYFGTQLPQGSFADPAQQNQCFPGLDADGKDLSVKINKPKLASALQHLLAEQATEMDLLGQLAFGELGGSRQQMGTSTGESWLPGQLELLLVLRCGVEAAASVVMCELLWKELGKNQQQELFTNLELPISPVLSRMETAGISMDVPYLESLAQSLSKEVLQLEQQVREAVQMPELNLASPKQLRTALFDPQYLGLSPLKKTKTGASTDAATLEALAKAQQKAPADAPARVFLDGLLAYRDKNKLQQIVVGLIEAVAADGCIHTTFVQTGAATGRLSSINPNLQNIPARSEEGMLVRGAFKAADDSEGLMSCDYSQLEMRIMASMSGDEALIEAINAGEDLHRSMAALVFSVPVEEVTAQQRSHVKATSYGLAYGLSAFGLASQLSIGTSQAKELMDRYFERFSGIKQFLDGVVEEATRTGYTETLFGRRRYFPDLHSTNPMARQAAQRAALNAPIQGTAADLMKRAMLKIDSELQKQGLKSRVLLQIHDELITQIYPGEQAQVRELITQAMRTADGGALRVPLTIGVGLGPTWREAEH